MRMLGEDKNISQMKVCASCGVIYYDKKEDKCPYCGKKQMKNKNYFLVSVAALLLSVVALFGACFSAFLGFIFAVFGLILGGIIMNRSEKFFPLALLGMVFSILSIIVFVFYTSVQFYYIFQMFR